MLQKVTVHNFVWRDACDIITTVIEGIQSSDGSIVQCALLLMAALVRECELCTTQCCLRLPVEWVMKNERKWPVEILTLCTELALRPACSAYWLINPGPWSVLVDAAERGDTPAVVALATVIHQTKKGVGETTSVVFCDERSLSSLLSETLDRRPPLLSINKERICRAARDLLS